MSVVLLKQYKGTICLAAVTIVLIVCNFFAIHALQSPRTEASALVTPTSVAVSSGDAAAEATTEATLTETTRTEATAASEPEASETQASPYKIIVYKGSQSVVVYKVTKIGALGMKVKKFTCSTGAPSSPTASGDYYKVRKRYRWRALRGNVYGQFCTNIGGNYFFHSVPYLKQDASTLENEEYDALGTPASMGCVRLCVRDAKWIFNNIPEGTPVTVTDEAGPGGAGVPKRNSNPVYNGWDPSDQWSKGNPYFDKNAASQAQVATATSAAPTSSTTEATVSTTTTTTTSPTAPAAEPADSLTQ